MSGREVSLRTLRTVRIVLVGMVFLYVWVGEKDGPPPRPVNPLWRITIYVLAASIVPTVLLVRSKELKRAKSSLARQPRDISALRRWHTTQLAILASLLAIPLYGLVLRFQGEPFVQVLPFYVAGILLMSFLPIHEAKTT